MKLVRATPWYADANSQRVVSISLIVIALLAMIDSVIVPFVGFGYLFLVPLAVAAGFLSRAQILILSIICTAFSEGFSKLPVGGGQVFRIVFIFGAYVFVMFV